MAINLLRTIGRASPFGFLFESEEEKKKREKIFGQVGGTITRTSRFTIEQADRLFQSARDEKREKKLRDSMFGSPAKAALSIAFPPLAGVEFTKTKEATKDFFSTVTEQLREKPERTPAGFLKATTQPVRAAINLLSIPISVLEDTLITQFERTPLKGKKIRVPFTDTELDVPQALAFAAVVGLPVGGAKKVKAGQALLKAVGKKMGLSEKQVLHKAEQGSDLFYKSIRRQLQKSGVKIKTTPLTPPDQVIKAFEEIKTSIVGLHKFKPNEIAEVVSGSKNVSSGVATLFRRGLLNVDDLPTFRKWGYTSEDTARFIENFSTFGGKDLNRISQWQKKLAEVIPEELATSIGPQTAGWTDQFFPRMAITTINLWRASLVSQMSTAVRNFEVANGFFALRAVEDALVGAAKTVLKKAPPKQAFAPVWEDLMVVFNRLSPTKRKLIAEVIEENPLIKGKLYATPVMDVAVTNKVAKVISVFNRTQEFAARNMFFEATLRGKLAQQGLKLENLKPTQISAKLLSESAEEALRLTFAQNPSGAFAKDMVRMSNKIPWAVMNMLVYPFPRFLSNSIKATFDLSPGGYLRFISSKNRAALLKGDDEALRIVAKATIGTGAFVMANFVRNSRYAGEKWYELQIPEDQAVPEALQKIGIKPGSTLDMRPFGPVFPTYMFLAEVVKTGGKGFGPSDWTAGMLGVNRIAGGTLFLTSTLAGSKDFKAFRKAAGNLFGQILGGYGTPAVTVRDFLGQFSKPERVARSTKENPLLGPFIEKLPFVRRILPEAPSITREGSFEKEAPLLRQLTGISIRTKTKLESEMDRLDIAFFEVNPKTGEPFIDRLIIAQTGPSIEKRAQAITGPRYTILTDKEKIQAIKDLFSEVKSEAKDRVFQENRFEIAALLFEKLFKLEDKEDRETLWAKWESKFSKARLNDFIAPIIIELKQKGYTPSSAFDKLKSGGFQTPLEFLGIRVP